MEILRVVGGRRLAGEARLAAAKNAVLPIIAAALLADGPVTLTDVPEILDVDSMGRILQALGCHVMRRGDVVEIDPTAACRTVLDGDLPTQLRSSVFLLGALLGRFRCAESVYPGGCAIGKRPIDLHLSGFSQLGAAATEENGRVVIDGRRMKAGDVHLGFPSVGATENLMMACAHLEGDSRIIHAAREPEIVDLANFLNAMGADVRGAGSDCICIRGAKRLRGVVYQPIPDRIVGGTLLAAGAISGGDILLRNAEVRHMTSILDALQAMGADIECTADGIRLRAGLRLRPVHLHTAPFPGFPTDLQAPVMALACCADGESVIAEDMFENRFLHAAPLRQMGADIVLEGRRAVVRGARLHGARVKATDLRCGASLVLAALAAEGVSEVQGVSLIDRGYERLERLLEALGADVRRLTDGR